MAGIKAIMDVFLNIVQTSLRLSMYNYNLPVKSFLQGYYETHESGKICSEEYLVS
ncbi:10682_t:CDS:2 [Funneliformis geosporum]|nr:10682_t:CDS:2 [Funneliformis geosporum]